MNKSLILVILILVILLVLLIDYFLKKRKNKNSNNETLRKKKSWSFYKYPKGVLRINIVITTIWTIVSVFSFFNNATGYNMFKYKVINNTIYPENFDASKLTSINRSIELIDRKTDDDFFYGGIESINKRKRERKRLQNIRTELLKGLAFSSTLDNILDIYYIDTFFTYCFFFQILYLVAFLLIIPILQKIMRWILDGFKNSKAKGIPDEIN